MALRTAVKRIMGATRPVVVRECRRCGMGVDVGTEECPECSSQDIHEYEIG